jgi:hypothetical protein
MMASDSPARLPLINTAVDGGGVAASKHSRRSLGVIDLLDGSTDTPANDDDQPVKFILLAEFDIDQGATLSMQYPFPTGTNEQ